MPLPIPDRLKVAAARILLPVLVGLVGAWLGLSLFGRSTTSMGPFRVQLDAGFGKGNTDIVLPPLGQITADTHLAPLRLQATLEGVNLSQLSDFLSGGATEELAERVERDAIDRLLPFTLKVLGVGLAGALAAATVAFRLKVRKIEIALVAALVAVGGSETLAAVTFRPEAFLSPKFSGSLSLAPQLIGPVEAAAERIDAFRSELQRVVDGALRAYASVQANPVGTGTEIRVLHISDIHLSALGYQFAQQVARGFDVDFVIDTGDVTSFGTPAENLIVQFIPGFHVPYVFVRGSHDSIQLQSAVAGIPNARVLDGTTTTVDGIKLYGLGDPYFVAERATIPSDRQIEDLVRSVGPTIRDDVRAMETPPDIVAVHDQRMAEDAAGYVPLVVSGHFHRNAEEVIDGTVFLQVGTTGAAGPTAFTADGGVPFSAEILYFEPSGVVGERPQLVAWDVIQQLPSAGNLTVTRHLVDKEFGELVPSPSPTESSGPTPSGSLTASPDQAASPQATGG